MANVSEEKICCFAGHRNYWHCVGIEQILFKKIENLILDGYTTFFDGNYGAFDNMCKSAVLKLKKKYPHVRLVLVLAYYNYDKSKNDLPEYYDGSIYPEVENYHYKARITKRNEWIVDNSDAVVCHIINTYNSGAFNTVKYAKKKNKKIIEV